MNKIIIKNSVKEIKKSFRRFLSLLLISMLGVGFFAGVKATTPDMQKTIDTYFDKENLFDIKIVSTLGLTDDDVKAINEIAEITESYGSYSKDVLVNIDDADNVVKVIEITDNINNVNLISGEMPKTSKECVVEDSLIKTKKLKIGDTIILKEELEEDEKSSFNETKLKIVGTVNSPLYISHDKGTSALGAGKLAHFIYVPKENIKEDYFTEIYVKVANGKDMDTTSAKYSNYVDEVIDKIDTIKEIRQKARYDSLIDEANEKLADSQKEFEEKKADGEKEIADAEKEIRDVEKKLKDAEKELVDNKEKAHNEFNEATNKLTKAGDELNSAEIEFNSKKEETERGFEVAEAKKEELQLNLDQVYFGLEEIEANYSKVILSLQTPNLTKEQKATLQATKIELEKKKTELSIAGQQIMAGIQEIDNQVQNGKAQLDTAQNQIMGGYNELGAGWAELNSKKEEANREFDKAEKEIADAKKEIADGKKELADAKQEFNEKIQDAENKILDARQKIDDIENPKWYILDRSSNNGYDSYINDTKNIEKLGNVFPILFFIIAVLISLTSMSRMVEEQRIELGTMKAFGYSNASICIKYVIYALGATVIGSIIGMIIGFNLIPRVIISMYQMMYPTITEAIIEFNTKYAILGLGLMAICTIGATLYSNIKELTSMPAMLMRPKPPKNGKRVFLEKITFIWNKLGFTEKVTVRNMFRYKKRFLMTIVGIMGCTALVLVGFSIKESISNLMNLQYEKVYNYDLMLGLNSSLLETEVEDLKKELTSKNEIIACTETYLVANELQKNGDTKVDVQVIIPKNIEEFSKFVNINNIKTGEKENLNDQEILLTEKAANLLDIKAGDKVTLVDNDENRFEVKVGAIVENYVYHYVFMSKTMYEKLYDEEYSSNVMYIQTAKLEENQATILNEEFLKNAKISSLTSTENLKNSMSKTLKALNQVVYVLIVSAGLLAFVVLYNLANVNISERKREIATLKVLGFYDKEVYDYITKEIIVLTVIGIILGLFGGYYLSIFILKTCETEVLIFKVVSTPISYILSALITTVFTIIVNFMTYFVLRKVDMIESLKSVE